MSRQSPPPPISLSGLEVAVKMAKRPISRIAPPRDQNGNANRIPVLDSSTLKLLQLRRKVLFLTSKSPFLIFRTVEKKTRDSRAPQYRYGVCLMEVVVDSDYFAKRCGGSIANCTADAIALARTADLFYRRVDLTASGQPEGIGFRAQWVTVIQSAETDETSAVPLAATGTKDRIGLQNAYIKATQSREPQPGSCIRAWLTNRDFKGTRGFATIGSNCRQIDKRRDVCETCKANPTVPDAYFGVCSTDYRHHLLVVSYFNRKFLGLWMRTGRGTGAAPP